MGSLSNMMMGSCEETGRLLSDFADNELPWRQRLRLRIHLAICKRCQAMLAGLRVTIASLRALAPIEPPGDTELPIRVIARISSPEVDAR